MAEPSPEIVAMVEREDTQIHVHEISTLGYPEQYHVNQAYLQDHGYEYDICHDVWLHLATLKAK